MLSTYCSWLSLATLFDGSLCASCCSGVEKSASHQSCSLVIFLYRSEETKLEAAGSQPERDGKDSEMTHLMRGKRPEENEDIAEGDT